MASSGDGQFDLFDGKAARDEGISSVAVNNKAWMAAALAVVRQLPYGWRGLSENIRVIIEQSVGKPTHPNAYGALIRAATKGGLLRPTGRRLHMRKVSSHARITDELERCF
jgi:hypothetical protein